jgi:hypothetical protein
MHEYRREVLTAPTSISSESSHRLGMASGTLSVTSTSRFGSSMQRYYRAPAEDICQDEHNPQDN